MIQTSVLQVSQDVQGTGPDWELFWEHESRLRICGPMGVLLWGSFWVEWCKGQRCFLPIALKTTTVARKGVSMPVAVLAGDCMAYGAATTPSGERDLWATSLDGGGWRQTWGDFLGSDCRQQQVEVVYCWCNLRLVELCEIYVTYKTGN